MKISNQAWVQLTQGKSGISPPSNCTQIESETMNFFERIEFLCDHPDPRRLKKFSEHTQRVGSLYRSPFKALQMFDMALWELRSGSKGKINDTDKKILKRAEAILLYEMNRLKSPVGTLDQVFSLINRAKKLKYTISKIFNDRSKIAWIGAALIGIAILYDQRAYLRSLPFPETGLTPPKPQPKQYRNSFGINQKLFLVSKEEDVIEEKMGAGVSRVYNTEKDEISFQWGNTPELEPLIRLPAQEKLDAFLQYIQLLEIEDLKKSNDFLERAIEKEFPPLDRLSIFLDLQQKYLDFGMHRQANEIFITKITPLFSVNK